MEIWNHWGIRCAASVMVHEPGGPVGYHLRRCKNEALKGFDLCKHHLRIQRKNELRERRASSPAEKE